MAVVNSFAKFYSASYPSESDVLATAPVYGDAINVLQGTASGGGACGGYPAVADVLSGSDTDMTEAISEEQLLALEIEAFMKLVKHPDTLDRMEHMLETGKPLRN